MKILHITTDDRGGAGLCCLRIHQSLLEQGIESKVVTLCNHEHVKEEYEFGRFVDALFKIPSKILRVLGLTVTDRNKVINLFREKGAAYSLPCSHVNLHSCKWTKWADIIHLHWVNNYLDYPSFFKKIDKPIVWTLHDENFFWGISHFSNTLIEDPLEKKYSTIKQRAISDAKNLNIVLLSEYFYNKFKSNELLKGRNVKVIPNSIDTDVFKPFDKKIARQKIGLSDTDIIIGFTAFIITDKRKGLEILSRTVEKIGNPRIKILAIGGNPDKKTYSNVITVGMLKNPESICEVLSAADYFAMPSYQEAFPQSPMEAMACGLPVVVFPTSGTSELVNKSNGVICDDFTEESLQKGIETLLDAEYAPKRIRQDMATRFSPQKIANQYIELYNEVLS